jgi:hypothetical protein
MKSFYRLTYFLSSKSKAQSQRSSNQGLTLMELITSTVVATLVISVSLGGAMFNRELYAQDEVRTRVNQSLRSAIDLVGADIQQMGEQIRRDDPNFPVVELTRNPANPSDTNWTSTLIMRRNLLPFLPVCQNLGNPGNETATPPVAPTAATGITQIQVFQRDLNPIDDNRPPGTCPELQNELDALGSAPAIDATLANWNTARLNNGGTLRAFLYDGSGGGQFVTVTGSTSPDNNTRIVTIQATNGEQFYAGGSARLYFLEERQYRVDANNNLQLTIDGGAPQTIVSGIQRFQVRITTNPIVATDPLINHFSFCERAAADRCFDPTAAADSQLDAWSVINNLRVTIVGSDPSLGSGDQIRSKSQESSRTLSEDFFPRNVMNFN